MAVSTDKRASSGLIAEVAGCDPVIAVDDPILGLWRLTGQGGHDVKASRAARRYGARAPALAELVAWQFALEGQGVRSRCFVAGDDAADASKAAVSCFATLDGRPWADPYGPAFLGQLVQQWRLDPHLIVRLVLDNVAPLERQTWSLFAVAADGATLTVTSWNEADPRDRTLLTLERQGTAPSRRPPMQDAEWTFGAQLAVRRSTGRDGTIAWEMTELNARSA